MQPSSCTAQTLLGWRPAPGARRRLNRSGEGRETQVAQTAETQATVAEVMAELAALEDPKVRAVNERHGDDHGVNLTQAARAREAAEDPAGARPRALGDR